MKIDREFAMIELTDEEAAEYTVETGCFLRVRKASADLADETNRTVEIRRESDGWLVGTVGID